MFSLLTEENMGIPATAMEDVAVAFCYRRNVSGLGRGGKPYSEIYRTDGPYSPLPGAVAQRYTFYQVLTDEQIREVIELLRPIARTGNGKYAYHHIEAEIAGSTTVWVVFELRSQ